MRTIELVKSRIAQIDRNSNSVKIEAACPVMKRQRVNGKMEWILQNPITLKWAIISEVEADELNDLYNIAKTGMSIKDDPFML